MDDLTLEDIAITEIGDMHDLGFAMAKMQVSWIDGRLKASATVEMEIPVAYDGSETIDALRLRVFERARLVISATSGLLAASNPPPVVKPPTAPLDFPSEP